MATLVLDLGQDAAVETLSVDRALLTKQEQQVEQLVRPSFARAADEGNAEELPRQDFNRDLYAHVRAMGEVAAAPSMNRQLSRTLERTWGDKLLAKLAPNANRQDYTSPFPKPDDTDNQPYNEGALLDALGAVSVALGKLQAAGVIGHWEISIPEDDDWNVVTVAVDDDISIGGQMLGRERNQPLSGSLVVALIRSAMESQAKISYKLDTFFIDPTTTKQDIYNPTQLLVSLSDLGQ